MVMLKNQDMKTYFFLILTLILSGVCFFAGTTPLAQEEEKQKEEEQKEEADEEASYEEAKNYEKLMKKFSALKRSLKKAQADKDDERLRTSADKIRFYASRILEQDPDSERRKKEDYKNWSQELEAEARKLRELGSADKLNWEAIEKQYEETLKRCESCHEVYGENEEE